MIRTLAVLTIAALILWSCQSSPYDYPNPIVMPDGGRGFGMSGFVSGTSSDVVAKQEVLGRFNEACGGPATIVQWRAQNADSLIGLGHVKYDAVAACQ